MSVKNKLKELAEENCRLKDRLLGLERARSAKYAMVSVLNSIWPKIEATQDPVARAWWFLRMDTLTKISEYLEGIANDIDALESANSQLSSMNHQLLDRVAELEKQRDELFNQ